MKTSIVCPNCGSNKAKKSSTYHNIVVCWCGGNVLNEVGEIVDGKVVAKFVPTFSKFPLGTMVTGIDQSYERSIYMVLDVFEIDKTKEKGLLLKIMYFGGEDYSKDPPRRAMELCVRPERAFKKAVLTKEQEQVISKPDFQDHKEYSQFLPYSSNKFNPHQMVKTLDNKIKGQVISPIRVISIDPRNQREGFEGVIVQTKTKKIIVKKRDLTFD